MGPHCHLARVAMASKIIRAQSQRDSAMDEAFSIESWQKAKCSFNPTWPWQRLCTFGRNAVSQSTRSDRDIAPTLHHM